MIRPPPSRRPRAPDAALLGLPDVPPVSVALPGGRRLHGLQTGWVAVKTAHERLRGPEALRLGAILADPRWAAPKPLLSWVLEHPEGLVVVDAGEVADANDLAAYARGADPGTRLFLSRNFRVRVAPERELGPQLRALGLSPRDVRLVVQTHLHFDHAGGLRHLPRAEVLVARAELEGHRRAPRGALASVWPRGLDPRPIDLPPRPCGPFARHLPLTRDGDVVVLPTPGHSYGHQSVLVRGGDRDYLLAGDVAFDEGQLRRRELAGIVHHVARARDSLERVRRLVAASPTVVLPTHDPGALDRLARGAVTAPGPGV